MGIFFGGGAPLAARPVKCNNRHERLDTRKTDGQLALYASRKWTETSRCRQHIRIFLQKIDFLEKNYYLRFMGVRMKLALHLWGRILRS